jgi:hypothetical protein
MNDTHIVWSTEHIYWGLLCVSVLWSDVAISRPIWDDSKSGPAACRAWDKSDWLCLCCVSLYGWSFCMISGTTASWGRVWGPERRIFKQAASGEKQQLQLRSFSSALAAVHRNRWFSLFWLPCLIKILDNPVSWICEVYRWYIVTAWADGVYSWATDVRGTLRLYISKLLAYEAAHGIWFVRFTH